MRAQGSQQKQAAAPEGRNVPGARPGEPLTLESLDQRYERLSVTLYPGLWQLEEAG
jgi:hypothetical protein